MPVKRQTAWQRRVIAELHKEFGKPDFDDWRKGGGGTRRLKWCGWVPGHARPSRPSLYEWIETHRDGKLTPADLWNQAVQRVRDYNLAQSKALEAFAIAHGCGYELFNASFRYKGYVVFVPPGPNVAALAKEVGLTADAPIEVIVDKRLEEGLPLGGLQFLLEHCRASVQ